MTTAIDINTNENISIKPIAIYQSDAFDVLLLADANTGKGIWRGFDYDSFGLPIVPLAPPVVRENDGSFQWLCGLLHAVWALSAEPHICEAKPAKPDMAHPLPQRFDPEIRKVKMLVLRENLHRPGGSADDDERVRREYSHRFIVRGFWRDQAYGPNHSLRRRQWIPPFVKGPADKPLICKETVRIWKR